MVIFHEFAMKFEIESDPPFIGFGYSVAISGDKSPNPRFWTYAWRYEFGLGDRSPIGENPRFRGSKIGDFGKSLDKLAILAIS